VGGSRSKLGETQICVAISSLDAGQNQGIKIVNRWFEMMAPFKCLEMAITDQNLIQEEIKWRLNPNNVCCHAVQNFLLSRFL
jgi:hypothetical protein